MLFKSNLIIYLFSKYEIMESTDDSLIFKNKPKNYCGCLIKSCFSMEDT